MWSPLATFHMQTVIPVLWKPTDRLSCVAVSVMPHTTERLPAVLDPVKLEKEGRAEEGAIEHSFIRWSGRLWADHFPRSG
jgi:hypothetical protein